MYISKQTIQKILTIAALLVLGGESSSCWE